MQFLFFKPTELGNTTFGVNGPNYDVKGVEAQFVGRVIDGLTLQGSGSYNDDTQANSPCLVDNIPASAGFGKCITQIDAKGVGLVPFQNPFGALGSVPAFSPRFQGNLRARYDWLIGDYKRLRDGRRQLHRQHVQPAGHLCLRHRRADPEHDLSALSAAGLRRPSTPRSASPWNNWYAQIFGTNLTNSHASTFTSSAQFIKSEVPLRPRVVGVKIGSNF